MTPAPPAFVTDESAFLQDLLPLAGTTLVELGCGKAELVRKLLDRGLVAQVHAFEVDARQHAANLAAAHPPTLHFHAGGAEATGLPDACCDGVLMLKSLHHVPIQKLDAALAEVRRMLRPGGWLYVSEPVYAGEFNDLVKLFHDEGVVRAAAYAALERARDGGLLLWEREIVFGTPVGFRDFDDFTERMIRVTHSDIRLPAAVAAEVRRRFEANMTPAGARWTREMRVNLLRRP